MEIFTYQMKSSDVFLSKIQQFPISISKMSSKNRSSKKSKTNVFYEIKRNDSQKNIEMARSINIIPLKTINRISSSPGQRRRLTENQPICKHSKRPQKLSLNLGNGAIVNFDQQFKRQIGTDPCLLESRKKIDIVETIDRMQKAELITVENNIVQTDVESFHRICSQFVKKIQELEKQNLEQFHSIKRYEAYFKELSFKKQPQNQQQNSFEEGKQNKNSKYEKSDKNSQLKILNLERKIETLNYIIKNYRTNNKEEIRNFEKKINDFKPSLENQLENLLADANKKNSELQSLIQYFRNQCEKKMKVVDWKTIVGEMKQKDEEISSLEVKLIQKSEQKQRLVKIIQKLEPISAKYEKLNKLYIDLDNQKNQFQEELKKCSEEKNLKQVELEEISQAYEELTFKYQGLEALQPKLKEKDEILSKNSVTIVRLENQISSLRSKITLALKSSQNELFGKASVAIENIEQNLNSIQQLSSRFGEELDNLSCGNQELSSFMAHLFERTKQSFQKIIEGYRQHLSSSQIENKELKNRLNSMISSSKRKSQLGEIILQEIQLIEEKRRRCVAAQIHIESLHNCTGCKSWLLNCGQINNACEQLQSYLKKYIQIF